MIIGPRPGLVAEEAASWPLRWKRRLPAARQTAGQVAADSARRAAARRGGQALRVVLLLVTARTSRICGLRHIVCSYVGQA